MAEIDALLNQSVKSGSNSNAVTQFDVTKAMEESAARRAEFQTKAQPLLTELDTKEKALAEGTKKTPASWEEVSKSLKVPATYEDPKSRSPWDSFGSLAMNIAVLGSFMTRRPIVSAMNAAASVLEANQAQDRHAAEKHFDIWKANMENVKTIMAWQHQNYTDTLAGLKQDVDGTLAKLKALADVYGDNTLKSYLEAKNIAGIYDTLNRGEKSQAQIGEIMARAQKERAETQAILDAKLKPETVELAARTAAKGNWTMVLRMPQKVRPIVVNKMAEIMQQTGASPEAQAMALAAADLSYAGQVTASRELGRRRAGFLFGSQGAYRIADQVTKTSEEFAARDWGMMTLNDLYSRGAAEFGNTKIVAFRNALNAFTFEYSRALTQVGVVSDSTREHIREMFNDSMTVNQIQAGIDQAKTEMSLIESNLGNVEQILSEMWKQSTPNLTPKFDPSVTEDKGTAPAMPIQPPAGYIPPEQDGPATYQPETPTTPTTPATPQAPTKPTPEQFQPTAPASGAAPQTYGTVTAPANGQGAPQNLAPIPRDKSMFREGATYNSKKYGPIIIINGEAHQAVFENGAWKAKD